jgi:hypothetical protein
MALEKLREDLLKVVPKKQRGEIIENNFYKFTAILGMIAQDPTMFSCLTNDERRYTGFLEKAEYVGRMKIYPNCLLLTEKGVSWVNVAREKDVKSK